MKKYLYKYNIIVPPMTEFTIINYNNKNILIVSFEDFFINIFIKSKITVLDETNSIILYNTTKNPKLNLISKYLNNYIWSWENWFFIKVKFKGKGYKIRKKNKYLKFFFWFSHIKLIKIINCKLRKIGNYRYMLMGTDMYSLKKTALLIRNIRRNDLFTKRGLRLAKEFIYKRQSKKITKIKN